MRILPNTSLKRNQKQVLYSSQVYMSRATKKYLWVNELKLKSKAFQHLILDPDLNMYAPFYRSHRSMWGI